jgi:hypothetical protein
MNDVEDVWWCRTPLYTGAVSGVSAVRGVSHYTASSYFLFLKKVLYVNFLKD